MSNEQPQDQPSAPPVPPVPPVPPAPPVPQWGEYASPADQAAAAVSAPPPPAPPTYVPTGYASAGYGAEFATPPKPKRRTWDLVLTIVLLVVGFGGMSIGVIYGLLFLDPTLMTQAFKAQGYDWNGDAGFFTPVVIISHVLLYLLVLGLSIPLLIKGRIVVFWIPLAAGVIAAIIFWGSLIAVMLSDPTFVNSVNAVS